MKITRKQLRALIIEAVADEKAKNLPTATGKKIVSQVRTYMKRGSKYKVTITCKDGKVTNIEHDDSTNIKPNSDKSEQETLKLIDGRVKSILKKEELADGKYVFNLVGGV
tara:strand:+ start:22 stop:351 length:330 start_codon:yes stop_codon:yes gene_type:complete